jgi:3-oxoacyl-[acyl-carrier-protein] synthase-3
MYKNVLVCGSDANSRVIDFQDRGTCVLFGDGAGAVVLSQTSIENNGFLNSFLGSDGSGAKHLEMKAGGSKYPASIETVQNRNHYLTMNGKEIYKFAVDIIPKCIENVIKGTDVTHDQIDYLIPHQANVRIIEGAAKRINLSMDKVHINLDKYGNTSSGTIPIALDEALKNKKIKKGDNIVLIGFGGGLTWGSALIKWV